jgi:hypothetical protein
MSNISIRNKMDVPLALYNGDEFKGAVEVGQMINQSDISLTHVSIPGNIYELASGQLRSNNDYVVSLIGGGSSVEFKGNSNKIQFV